MQETKQTLLSLGTNQGNRLENIQQAYQLIEERVGTIVRRSKVYSSEAWGLEDQADFMNTAILVETTLSPIEVLDAVLQIEADLGRVRLERWGPRLIDIDVLFYENEIIDTARLTLPHPQIEHRNFVLIPLLEIAPDFIHPILQLTIDQLYWACKDDKEVYLHD